MTTPTATDRTRVVESYLEGFRRGDHEKILACLAEDIVWELHGYTTLHGKAAFDAEIENEGFEGGPQLYLDRMIETADTVVVLGRGSVARTGGERVDFTFCEVFTFTGDTVSRLDTYHVWSR